MTKKENFIWKLLQVVSWIIFIGFCIQTGALIFNFIYSLFRPIATHDLYLKLNLSELYERSFFLYVFLFSLAITISGISAWLFYLVIKLFDRLNLVKPFSEEVADLISRISYYAFSIGLLGVIAISFTKELTKKGFEVSTIGRFWEDSVTYLMMSAIIFIISLIFKRGIELQKENDLTI